LEFAKSLAETLSNIDLYLDNAGSGKSLHDLLARSDIEAVTTALSIPNQAAHVRSALLAGKHMLLKNSIAQNSKDAMEQLQWEKRLFRDQSFLECCREPSLFEQF
jgi:predicted dehydrogenase